MSYIIKNTSGLINTRLTDVGRRNISLGSFNIAYFQIGDNPGRKEPTTGEINYPNVFKFINEKGFDGILGMEHGNSIEGKEGEKAVITAYQSVDQF